MEVCPICKRKFKRLSASHASTHGKTVNELRAIVGEYREETGQEIEPIQLPAPDYGSLSSILTREEQEILTDEQKAWLLHRIKGESKQDAAELVGINRQTLYTSTAWKRVMPILDSILVRVLSDEVLAARAITLATAKEAALVNAQLLRDYDSKVQLAAAHDILDRSGLSRRPGPNVSVEAETLNLYYSQLSTEELDEEITRLLKEELEREGAIEGEFSVVEDEPFVSRDWQNRAFQWYWYTVRQNLNLNSADEFRVLEAFKLNDIYGNDITREEAEKVLESFGVDWRQVE